MIFRPCPTMFVLLSALALLAPEIAVFAADAAKNVSAATPEAPFNLGKFLAPFHSVVLHYPIGFVTLAVILEIYSSRRPSPELRKVISLVMGLAALSAVVAAVFGILRAGGGGYEEKTLNLHRWTGILVTAVTIIGWAIHRFMVKDATRAAVLKGYRFLISADLIILIIAGHEGGNLTHGSNYLLEGAPAVVKTVIDIMEDNTSPKIEAPVEKSKKVFVQKIRPILEAKCVKCHGPEKMKGNYRLDVGESALKGGDSGKAGIKPGDAFQSNFARVILLPREHDDAMPPTGKEPLTTEELVTLLKWIQDGAPFADFGVLAKSETKPAEKPEPKPEAESTKPEPPAKPAELAPLAPATPEKK